MGRQQRFVTIYEDSEVTMHHLPHLFYIAGSLCFIIGTIFNW